MNDKGKTLFYKLRSDMNIQVSFYDVSGKRLQSRFPDWTLATDANGRRHLPVGLEDLQDQRNASFVAAGLTPVLPWKMPVFQFDGNPGHEAFTEK